MKQVFVIIIAAFFVSVFTGQKLVAQTMQGGGIYAKDAQVTSSVISNNLAEEKGTGVYADGASKLINNTVVGNMQVSNNTMVGREMEGGVVFYVDMKTRKGLVVSVTEAPANAPNYYRTWGESSQDITSAVSPEDGKANHDGIIAAQVIWPDIDVCRDNDVAKEFGGCKNFRLPADTARRAAHWCKEYRDGERSDWFLPSREQLKKLYVAKAVVNATLIAIPSAMPLNDGYYWSSTQADAYEAWYVYFGNGEVNRSVKSNAANVRAIREFSF